jgi:hypothetical protein
MDAYIPTRTLIELISGVTESASNEYRPGGLPSKTATIIAARASFEPVRINDRHPQRRPESDTFMAAFEVHKAQSCHCFSWINQSLPMTSRSTFTPQPHPSLILLPENLIYKLPIMKPRPRNLSVAPLMHTVAFLCVLCPALRDSSGKVLEHRDGALPVNTGIGNGNTLLESAGTFSGYFLVALVDVGLDHDGNDAGLSFTDLVRDDLGDLRLVAVVFVGVSWKCW